MYLVTGAAGKTGRAVVRALAERGAAVRALVRRAGQADELRKAGAHEVQVGDLEVSAQVARAMQGVSALYHICPNMHKGEAQIGQSVIAAARTAGVEQIVYHSVLHPQTAKMAHHWNKLQVEEQLFKSGLAYTILQPTAYMQNLLASWRAVTQEGLLALPYPTSTRISLVDLADVAQVAATVLGNGAHHYATYELVGTRPVSQADVAAALAHVLGRPVHAREITLDLWEQQARQGGALSEYAIQTLLSMFRYYANFGLEGNPQVLTQLLGRAPTGLEEFAARTARFGE